MSNLNVLKENIEKLTKFHQIEILKIIKSDETIIINENNNGIFINLTNVSKDIIEDIINYLKYVDTQEKLLNDIEDQKETLTNTFFKDNKDNTYISINE
tara:strand:+ start:298 stop:594 length:297 start_codon:yes stop_codon:yes gene_type:complete